MRDAIDSGWQVPIANVSFVGSESMLALLLKEGQAKGKDYTRQLVNSQVVPSYEDLQLPAIREYREMAARYAPELPAEFRQKPSSSSLSFVGLEGFLNAKLLVEILTRLGAGLDNSQVRQVVEGIRDLDLGIAAPITFGPGDNQGLNKVYYTRVENGRFVPLQTSQ